MLTTGCGGRSAARPMNRRVSLLATHVIASDSEDSLKRKNFSSGTPWEPVSQASMAKLKEGETCERVAALLALGRA